jgi:hypothetical protein
MKRRGFLQIAAAGACALAGVAVAGGVAFAGSYLDRAALMLDEAHKEIEAAKTHTSDKELLLVVKAATEARLKVARKMNVPAAVTDAHPHLMLVLENHDRALDAVIAGNTKKFAECLITATNEEATFRNLIKQLGYALPKVS